MSSPDCQRYRSAKNHHKMQMTINDFFFCSKHNNLFLWIQTTVNRPFVLPPSACCFSELLSMLKPINSYFGKINNIRKPLIIPPRSFLYVGIRRKSVHIYKSFHIPLTFLSNKTLRCRLRFNCKRLFVVSSIKFFNGNVAYMRVNAIVQSAVFFHKILKRKCFNIILIKNRLEYVHCSFRKHNLLWL